MKLFDDVIKNITEQSYNSAIGDFLEFFQAKEWVRSIAQIGDISSPGISDLDCLIVVRNNHLNDVYRSFIDWRRQSDIREYFFPHPPIFITEEMQTHLPYLHTLHSLRWLYNKSEFNIDQNREYIYYLNLIWASYILSISLNMFFNTAPQSLRKALLIMKNIHISCDILSNYNDIHDNHAEKSKGIRENIYIHRNIPDVLYADIQDEFSESMNRLLTLLDNNRLSGRDPISSRRKKSDRLIKKNIKVCSSLNVSIAQLKNGQIFVSMNETTIDNLLTPWFVNMEANELLGVYRDHLIQMYRYYRTENVPFNYVTPFDIPVYKGRRHLTIREYMLRGYRLLSALKIV
jgi:hypothetical protein